MQDLRDSFLEPSIDYESVSLSLEETPADNLTLSFFLIDEQKLHPKQEHAEREPTMYHKQPIPPLFGRSESDSCSRRTQQETRVEERGAAQEV